MAIVSKTLRIADNAAMTNARSIAESATPNKFDISGLNPETTYYVEVDVVNDRGTGTSAQSNFTTEAQTGMEPFNIKNISANVATVDWNTNADNRNLQYSEDKTTWTNVPYANNKYTIQIPVGKKYYFQGNSTNFGGWWGSDEDVEISGYVLSLHSPDYSYTGAVSYNRLFDQNNNTANAGHLYFNFSHFYLPVKNMVGREGFSSMFRKCTTITELNYDIFYTDDGTVRCSDNAFNSMFTDVPNLTRVDGFNLRRFKTLGSWQEFQSMFANCTNLQYVADDFFDTTLTPSTGYFRESTCAYMFSGCTSLTHPPILPSVRGSQQFRSMFSGCTSLTNASTDRIMPSYSGIGTQSGEYGMARIFQGMFYGCTGLTSMHDLSSYTMGSYGNQYFYQMYYGCTGITSIDAAKMPGGVATTNCFREMFRGCTGITSVPSGFIKPTNTAESCYQDMFRQCTGITTIPSGLLTATTLTKNCYAGMFYGDNHITAIPSGFMSPTTVAESCCMSMFEGCSALTTIPSGLLPALTMEKNCYNSMFRSCTALANVPTDLLPATTLAEGCYNIMFQYDNHGFTGLHLGATELVTEVFASLMFFDCPISQLEVDFKEWTTGTTGWVTRTSGSGTFTKYEALPEIYDVDHIPSGWTVVNKYFSETPTITHDDVNVIIVNNTYNGGGDIYYTTDGSTPTSASNVYTQPFTGVIGQTIKAICIYHDIVSDVASWTVAAEQLAEPTITGLPTAVTITNNDTSGASAVYYTTDGTTPTSSSTLYQGAFTVNDGDTVKAICVNTTGGHLYFDSDVVSKQIRNRTVLSYIYAQTMSTVGDADMNKLIDTGVALDNTLKVRWWGLGSSYASNCLMGNITSNGRQVTQMQGGGGWIHVLWVNSLTQAYTSFPNNTPIDFTMGNRYLYNNLTQSYICGNAGDSAPSPNTGNCLIDIVSHKCAGAQVWKTINGVETLLFDGVAAELQGVYGLWDNITHQMFTNTNITITGE